MVFKELNSWTPALQVAFYSCRTTLGHGEI